MLVLLHNAGVILPIKILNLKDIKVDAFLSYGGTIKIISNFVAENTRNKLSHNSEHQKSKTKVLSP